MSNTLVYNLKENVEYEIVNDIVYLIKRENHPIQKFMRKIKIRIPEISRLELDAYGSFVFLQIDGNNTIDDIAHNLDEKYQEAAHPLYERLIPFLNYLHDNLKIIEVKE